MTLVTLPLKQDEPLNLPMPALYAALSTSGIYESPKYVDMLIDSGAYINYDMPDIVPPLHSSILCKHLEIVKSGVPMGSLLTGVISPL